MNIKDINSIDTLMNYSSNLSEQVCRSQLDASEQTFIHAPKDYATSDTHEAVIESNADLLASYYREYERNLADNPNLLKEFLAQKLGEEFIAMMGRRE